MKLELKHVAGYLPYGLKATDKYGNIREVCLNHFTYDTKTVGINHLITYENQTVLHKPTLRNLSDLTKEIEVNGEKFVPMVKLAEMAGLDTTDVKLNTKNFSGIICSGIACNIENDDNDDEWEVLAFDNKNGFGHHFRPSNDWTIVMNQFELWEKLFEWHFDIHGLIESGLAIDMNTLNESK